MFSKFIKRGKMHKPQIHSSQYTPMLSFRDESTLSGKFT